MEGSIPDVHLEVTPINRQSYMAEISSLLGLITDENTREVLIAKMERMFDAAEDEQALINDIGSPTKVAVALIRYADNGVVTPEAAAVIETVTDDEPEQEDEFDTLEALDEQPELMIPEDAEASVESEAEAESEAEPEPAAEPEEIPEPAEEAPAAPAEEPAPEPEAEPAPAVPEEPPADAAGFFTEAPDLAEPEQPGETLVLPDTFVEEQQATVILPDEEPDAPVEEPEAEEAPEEAPYEEDADEALYDASKLPPELSGESDEDDEPLTVTKVNTFLAILYFIIPGLVIGLPVFLVLLVLNLAFLVVAAAVIAAAVLLVITGLSPLGLPDMLLCFGSAAAVLAVGLVLLWFTIWFFICVTCGWVRLMTRGGKFLSRKEVEIV